MLGIDSIEMASLGSYVEMNFGILFYFFSNIYSEMFPIEERRQLCFDNNQPCR
jgi:hypothetical protein